MSQPLSQFVGEFIYLDTMLPYALLRGIEPVVKTFFSRLEHGDFTALPPCWSLMNSPIDCCWR